MQTLLRECFQPVVTSEPIVITGRVTTRQWHEVGIIDLANFFLKCWLANLFIALVFGVIGFVVSVVFLANSPKAIQALRWVLPG
jgi:hypothetical protein